MGGQVTLSTPISTLTRFVDRPEGMGRLGLGLGGIGSILSIPASVISSKRGGGAMVEGRGRGRRDGAAVPITIADVVLRAGIVKGRVSVTGLVDGCRGRVPTAAPTPPAPPVPQALHVLRQQSVQKKCRPQR